MVKFDYSLDVGESIKTDNVLKEKEKEAPNCGGCGAPKKIVKLSDEDKITDQEEEIKEKEQETVEEEQLENVPETEKKKEPEESEETDEKVEIKPISFEKAKLVSDFTEEPKKAAEEPKKSAEEPKKAPETPVVTEDTEEEIEKPEEEDEKDVNEFLDDSFSKEAKKYEQFNNNKTKVTVEEPVKRSIWPIILLIILIGAAALMYGYAVFKEPADNVTVPEIVNTIQPVEPIIALQNTTDNITLPEKTIIEEQKNKTVDNKTIDQALEMFTAGLKD